MAILSQHQPQMGIPSYFSHIIRSYPKIIKTWHSTYVDNFYLDSNSIIYDAFYQQQQQYPQQPITSDIIIQRVIKKINEYLDMVKPKKEVMIALDGVAPVAKLEQQRQRRYKSRFQTNYNQQHQPSSSSSLSSPQPLEEWSTAQITPGTKFMETLANQLNTYYKNFAHIKISSSLEVGEGEHKIFEHIRQTHVGGKGKTVIYGLDADLIVLSLNHLEYCPELYLLREAPHFDRQPATPKPKAKPHFAEEMLLLDIRQLGNYIGIPIPDYLVLTFFLGNDFLPHFPATNIRSTGIDTLVDAWKTTKVQLVQPNGKLNLVDLKKFIEHLANQERELVQQEYERRNKREPFVAKTLENIPMWKRELEHYWMSVPMFGQAWKDRYYQTFFPKVGGGGGGEGVGNVQHICYEFIERLTWTLEYYQAKTTDWRGHYPYPYPPLYQDLATYLTSPNPLYLPPNEKKSQPVNAMTQLCYVLPKEVLKEFLPPEVYEKYWKKYHSLYESEPEFIWGFCKFFWESHVVLPSINLEELEDYLFKKEVITNPLT